MYNNLYASNRGDYRPPLHNRRGPTGQWHHAFSRNYDRSAGAGQIQRRPPGYVPWQSVFDPGGRYAYNPAGQQWPRYVPEGSSKYSSSGLGDYGTGDHWDRIRPGAAQKEQDYAWNRGYGWRGY